MIYDLRNSSIDIKILVLKTSEHPIANLELKSNFFMGSLCIPDIMLDRICSKIQIPLYILHQIH